MGLVIKLLVYHTFLIELICARAVYDNLNANVSLGLNCSEALDKLGVTGLDYSVEDFTDYSQDQEEEKYKPDIPKSRQPRSIKRVLSWVGRGFGKVFNSPYIYNFYPIINYSVGKIMQHLPFIGNSPSNSGNNAGASPDYQQSSVPQQPNPQQMQQQQQMQQEYEEEMEKKQQEMQHQQEEAEARAKHAAEEKKIINERAKKLAAKYVEMYFQKHTLSSQTTTQATSFGMLAQNFIPGAYNVPAQPAVYNNPPAVPAVYDQAYAQPNYGAAYPAEDNLAEPVPYNPVNYVNTQ